MIYREHILKRHIKNYLGGGFAFLCMLSLVGVGFSSWVVEGNDTKYTDLVIEADTVVTEDKYIQCFEDIKITKPLYYSEAYGYFVPESNTFTLSSGTSATFEGTFKIAYKDKLEIIDFINLSSVTLNFSIEETDDFKTVKGYLKEEITTGISVSGVFPTYNLDFSSFGSKGIEFVKFSFSITIEYLKNFSDWNKTLTLKLCLGWNENE